MTERQEVITRFCNLQALIAHNIVGYETSNDCFCGEVRHDPDGFRSDMTAIKWLEGLVERELTK